MKQLKIMKNAYSAVAICLIVLGAILLFWPQTTLEFICKLIGILLLVSGVIKIVSYFTKDLFQLAFQFDFGLGIISVIVGLIMLIRTEHLIQVISAFIGILILIDATLKIQTAIEAKKFGIERWWIVLVISVIVTVVGALLVFMPLKTTEFVIRLIGINFCLDGILNLWVVQKLINKF